MPTRSHHARHEPPSTLDRALAHPWTIAIAAYWSIVGVALATTPRGPAPAIGHVSNLTAWWLTTTVTAGGLLVLAGVLWHGKDGTAWTLEMIGLALAAGAWGTYSVGETDLYYRILAITFVAGALLRITAGLINREHYHKAERRRSRRSLGR